MNYTEQELIEIYMLALEKNIKDEELTDIKEALYIITPLLKEPIPELYDEILFLLKSTGLNISKIDAGFVDVYDTYCNNADRKFNSYELCANLINILYAPLPKTAENYDNYANSLSFVFPVSTNNEVFEKIKEINAPLGNLLLNSREFIDNRPGLQDGPLYLQGIHHIFEDLIIAFLKNIDYYEYDYTMPSNIIMNILENRSFARKILEIYYEKDNEAFARALLNRYKDKKEAFFPKSKEKSISKSKLPLS